MCVYMGGAATLSGSLHPGFAPVAGALQRQLAGSPGGAALCVYHRGECVVDVWGGFRDEAGAPWTRDTMSPSFSTTKGVASTLVHILVDRGLIDYDERVAHYWPEFAQAGKDAISVRHVLSHQSGLYHIRQMIDHADRMRDWEHMIRAIERTSPIHEPGTRTGYHGLTYGFLVGEIVQRVTGETFPSLVRREIAEPLGLDGLYIGAPEEALPRAAQLMMAPSGIAPPEWLMHGAGPVASLVRSGAGALAWGARAVGLRLDLESIVDALAPRGIGAFDFGSPDTLRAAIPAANGLFTARSLARMYAALAGGGEVDRVRLISQGTLARATEQQAADPDSLVLPFDMRWRLGYHGVMTTRGMPRRAFGHFGFGGSGAWADPSRDLAVALIVNSGLGTPLGDLRIAQVSGAVLGCVRALSEARRAA